MAIIQVASTNPQFSFLMKKNPNSGMQLRSVRQGTAYGWYSEPAAFNVYFKDADNEISFKQHQGESFEYLNVSRYNTPLFPLAAINEFFGAPFKKHDEVMPDMNTSVMFRFLNDDKILVLDLRERESYEQAEAFFSTLTIRNRMEGVVIKPEVERENAAPYLKVRNSEYLSIIYGYDYRFPHKYAKLLKQKNTHKKLRTSIAEHQLGKRMLGVKYDEISPSHGDYQEIAMQLLFEMEKEKEIDPRL